MAGGGRTRYRESRVRGLVSVMWRGRWMPHARPARMVVLASVAVNPSRPMCDSTASRRASRCPAGEWAAGAGGEVAVSWMAGTNPGVLSSPPDQIDIPAPAVPFVLVVHWGLPAGVRFWSCWWRKAR